MRGFTFRWFAAVLILAPAIAAHAVDAGFQSTYYDNSGFSGPTLSRIDPTIDFPWGNGSPAPSLGADTYCARWTAILRPSYTEAYTLYATTDDGVRVWIDGQLVINAWRDRAPETTTATVALTAGAAHAVRIDYFENYGGASAKLEWSSPSQTRQVIPAARLEAGPVPLVAPWLATANAVNAGYVSVAWDYLDIGQTGFRIERSAPGGAFAALATVTAGVRRYDDTTTAPTTAYTYRLVAITAGGESSPSLVTVTTPALTQGGEAFLGSYWDNVAFTGTRLDRLDQTIAFNWGNGSPESRFAADTFSARWLGRLPITTAGVYEFRVTSDDGVRFWLDDQLIVERWNDHPATVDTVSQTLAARTYDVRIDYYENYGGAQVQMEWRPAGGAWAPLRVLAEMPRPFAPQAFTAAPTGEFAVALAWQAPPVSGDEILVERRAGDATEWTTVIRTGATAATDTQVTAGVTYRYRTVTVRADQRSNASAEIQVTVPTPGTGSGLTGLYTDDAGFERILATRVDPQVNFNWVYAAPIAGVPAERFAVRWVGQLQPIINEAYTLRISADDAFRLYLDGVLVIDAWDALVATREVTIPATQGQRVALRLDYREITGQASVTLEWSAPHHLRSIVPSSQLYPTTDAAAPGAIAALRADYVSDRVLGLAWTAATDDTAIDHYRIERDGVLVGRSTTTTFRDQPLTPSTAYAYRVTAVDVFGKAGPTSAALTVTTVASPTPGTGTGLTVTYFADLDLERPVISALDPVPDHVWSAEPAPGVPADFFGVSWNGWIQPFYSEEYTFTLTADAGARLWIDGQLLAASWGGGSLSRTWRTAPVAQVVRATLTAGSKHRVRLDLGDTTGPAVVKLAWESRRQAAEVIPTAQLHPLVDADRVSPVITTAAGSRTSPAQVEGTIGGPGSAITAFVSGLPTAAQRMSATGWMATEAAPGLPPGVVLSADRLTEVRIVANDGDQSGSTSQWLVWEVTDFADLPYGLAGLTIRSGDSVLLAASGTGDATFVLRAQSGPEVARWTVTADARVPHRFDAPGAYFLSAFRGATELATLPLVVAGIDWSGPTACAIAFERQKTIAVKGIDPVRVDFAGFDPDRTAARVMAVEAGAVVRLGVKPLLGGTNGILARLGPGGPVISRTVVDEFNLISLSSEHVHDPQILPGGIVDVEAEFILQPWVMPLDIKAYCFTAGVTLDDGTTVRWIPSAGLHSHDEGATAEGHFRLRKPLSGHGAFCHALQAYQAGVLVSP